MGYNAVYGKLTADILAVLEKRSPLTAKAISLELGGKYTCVQVRNSLVNLYGRQIVFHNKARHVWGLRVPPRLPALTSAPVGPKMQEAVESSYERCKAYIASFQPKPPLLSVNLETKERVQIQLVRSFLVEALALCDHMLKENT